VCELGQRDGVASRHEREDGHVRQLSLSHAYLLDLFSGLIDVVM
jgi:hypothetical protein